MFKTWSGLSSNDGRVSNPKPARSDGLDNVDGGPDGTDIALKAIAGKQKCLIQGALRLTRR
jgi:hypothetical protein